ncbi:hypothetical protein FRC01_013212 [Tulasnella sp. 417]|nr:hypothetical protein FRC01_013212 [Tulasnella sp. 417]
MAPLGTAANPFDIRSPTEFSGSPRSTPSEFSVWSTYPPTVRFRSRDNRRTSYTSRLPSGASASGNIAGPSNQRPTGDHTGEDSHQSRDENLDQSGDASNQTGDADLDPNSDENGYQGSADELGQGGDEEQELEDPEIEEFRKKMNSSIVVGTQRVLNTRERLDRTGMFDLEMSEARGGMIFDYEFLQQFILGDMDREIAAAEPTSELENRRLIFEKVKVDRRQREFYQALEKRLDELGGHHLRPRALERGGADAVRRMILLSLKAYCHLDFVHVGPDGTRNRRGGARACNICEERMDHGNNSRFCRLCSEHVMRFFPRDEYRLSNPKIRKMFNILQRTENAPVGSRKSIVICQFSAFARVIAERLRERRFVFVEFSDCNIDEKRAAMRRIRCEQHTTVALATVNPADIHGLDLRPFDSVILMDLWWDPLFDARAFHQDHEVDVEIYKLYFENTVENRIFELLQQPPRISDSNQEIIHQLGIYSTLENLDFLLKPT